MLILFKIDLFHVKQAKSALFALILLCYKLLVAIKIAVPSGIWKL